MFDPAARAKMLERLQALRPDSPRSWGTLSPVRMLWHLDRQLLDVLGEQPLRRLRRTRFENPLMRWLLIDVLPWPHDVRTAPEMVAPALESADLEAGRAQLRSHLEAWTSRGEAAGAGRHPLFGDVDGRAMGKLLWKHWNHHFSQFGV